MNSKLPNQPKSQIMFHKVQLFWEGFKNLRNLSHGFDIYKIVQIFVAFSEKLNFKQSPNAGLYFKDFESFGHKPLSKSESIYFVFTDR